MIIQTTHSVVILRLILLLLLVINSIPQVSSVQCNSTEHCIDPVEVGTINHSSLVECRNGGCICLTPCLHLFNNTCRKSDDACYYFEENTSNCVSNNRSWSTALILSILLAPTGAANFYIYRYEYAIPQILLFLSPILGFLLCMANCIFISALSVKSKSKFLIHSLAYLSLFIFGFIGFSIPLITLCWNIYDVIVFSLNNRLDSNGCTLSTM